MIDLYIKKEGRGLIAKETVSQLRQNDLELEVSNYRSKNGLVTLAKPNRI